jgi:hypothetical protein
MVDAGLVFSSYLLVLLPWVGVKGKQVAWLLKTPEVVPPYETTGISSPSKNLFGLEAEAFGSGMGMS